jgi:hypothetical protein
MPKLTKRGRGKNLVQILASKIAEQDLIIRKLKYKLKEIPITERKGR